MDVEIPELMCAGKKRRNSVEKEKKLVRISYINRLNGHPDTRIDIYRKKRQRFRKKKKSAV